MAKQYGKLYVSIVLILLLFLGWAVFFHFYSPAKLVSSIGLQNTYLVAFLLALIGGFSSITGTSLEATLFAFSHDGINPIVLGIISGLGLFASDSIFYFVALKMRSILIRITIKWERLFRHIWKWIYLRPKWMVLLGIFAFAAFLPFPNDVMLAVLALSGYSYEEFWPALLFGDLTLTLLITALGSSTG